MRKKIRVEKGRGVRVGFCVVAVVLLATVVGVFGLKSSNTARAAGVPVLVGAGDIAACNSQRDEATARLLGRIEGTIFALGDNVYDRGSTRQFANCYGPSWGRYKARTKPAVGNHEYYTPGAKPYYDYFGARAGNPRKGYYSYDRGSWHVVVLNSNCAKVGGCGLRSPQARWLKNDLFNNPSRCTAAYFHHPLFSSVEDEATPEVRPFWRILYGRGADVILSGHAHVYERFAPQTPYGAYDADRGIRQFVVGTGGKYHEEPFVARPATSRVRNKNTPGVLKLSLGRGTYGWRFVPVAGKTFTDSGSGRCH